MRDKKYMTSNTQDEALKMLHFSQSRAALSLIFRCHSQLWSLEGRKVIDFHHNLTSSKAMTYSRVTLVFVKSSILLQWCFTLRFQSYQSLCLKQLFDKVGTFFTISSRLMTSGYALTFIFCKFGFQACFCRPTFTGSVFASWAMPKIYG